MAKTYTMLHIKTDGTETVIKLDHHPNIEQLHKLVNGYIERVELKYNGAITDMIVNEEGLIKNLGVNHKASILNRYGGIYQQDIIFGDVVIFLNFRLE